MEGCDIRMALTQIGLLFLFGKPELFKETKRIAVPTGDIEIIADGVMVELRKETHEIVDDIAPGRGIAQDFDLHPVEGDNLIRGKTPEIEPVCRIGLCHGQIGKVDLCKAAIFHRPEDIAPCTVER